MFNDNTGHCGSPSAHLSHAGSDIKEGHKMFTLAFVWQLMRAYTLSLLAKLSSDGKPVTEAQIIEWANNKVKNTIRDGGSTAPLMKLNDNNIIHFELLDNLK